MIETEKVLAVIPARGGSKRLPRKNITVLGGKPLLAWTIEAARASRHLDRVVLSSDDEEIMRVAREWACEVPFTRPAELAGDEAPGIAPVLHALRELPGYSLVVLLQPTSPLRLAADIDACIRTCVERGAPACVSVTVAAQNPHWMFTLGEDRTLRRLLPEADLARRSQDLPRAYALNGAVYVARADWLRAQKEFVAAGTVAYEMPSERSVDIDDEADLRYAEFLMGSKHATLQ